MIGRSNAALAGKPRILVLSSAPSENPLARCQADLELTYADSVPQVLALLQRERFDAVCADITDLTLIRQAGTLIQADRILEMLADGVAIVDADLRVVWANAEFERWCGGPVEGKSFYEALGSPEILGPDYSPFHTALRHGPIFTRLHAPDGRYLQLHVTPVRAPGGEVSHYICLGRDITAEHQQQQKLDAIHRAGRELAALDPDELATLTSEERVELLKSNILRHARHLLQYDVMEIRLLDEATGRLDPLILTGVTPEAAGRTLYARTEGNGITGFVAATGKSYLCPDTTNDPLYLEGAAGARSSLTVPLLDRDRVIGTFNVESPRPGAFGEQDQQFLEIFSREIADALHTLELLVAERRTTATQSVEAVRREVALPVDEILAATAALLDRYIGHDPEMADRLKDIQTSARSIKECITRVGETLVPAAADAAREPVRPRLRGLRVLVADHDERVRRSAHSILGRFGCIVETARDGKEAVAMARLGNYDAIISDIRLPDITGYEIFRRLREAAPNVPVILMSGFGYDPSHTFVKARQEGGLSGVLYKPFRVDQLLETLEKLLDSRNGAPLAAATT
jgi:CheY-like chemotaxis protein/GAF domain-containing protein